MNVKIYVEGGGPGKSLKTECKKGFAQFFAKAGLDGRMPKVVSCGSRNDAFDDFCTALRTAAKEDFPVLLVDSESPVADSPWPHLAGEDNWDRPQGTQDDQAHLMVQCMEAWFLADRRTLAEFFGPGFTPRSLPRDQDVERVDKSQLLTALHRASRNSRKGAYRKGSHSFDILRRLEPSLVRKASRHADALLCALDARCD